MNHVNESEDNCNGHAACGNGRDGGGIADTGMII